jgi:hypothetical protein
VIKNHLKGIIPNFDPSLRPRRVWAEQIRIFIFYHQQKGCSGEQPFYLGYLTLINNAWRTYIQQQAEPLEETLRRVVREELKRAA